MEQIACKECTSPDCHGCNMYRLERMLMSGKLDALMGENRGIKMDADVRPVVLCKHCKYWKHLGNTSHFVCTYVHGVEFVRSADDFCSRGERGSVKHE